MKIVTFYGDNAVMFVLMANKYGIPYEILYQSANSIMVCITEYEYKLVNELVYAECHE